MRPVRCQECGREYDYDRDDLCPKCGSFNLPADQGVTQLEQQMLERFRFARRGSADAVQASHVLRDLERPVACEDHGARSAAPASGRGQTCRRQPPVIPPAAGAGGRGTRQEKKKDSLGGTILLLLLVLLFWFLFGRLT